MITEGLITTMVVVVGVIATVLTTYLLVMVYRTEDGARLPPKGK